MPHPVRSILAASSPLFVLNTRLYSESIYIEIINNCFQLQPRSINANSVPRDVLAILSLLAQHQMRVSELLNIICRDYLGSHRWLVRGLKRSRNYVVVLPTLQLGSPGESDPRWSERLVPYTYNYIWSWASRAGVGGVLPGHRNNSRTHAHRYHVASAVNRIAGKRAAGDVLHHNSRRAVESYIL